MKRLIGFMGFFPMPANTSKPIPVKICFYHKLSGFPFARMIEKHEKLIGFSLTARETLVTLDTDSDVTLESCSKNGEKVKRVITRDEMKCLLHYIVFYIKDYEIVSGESIREMNVNILQNDEIRARLHIKIVATIVYVISRTFYDFMEDTVFQTIGKNGITYGLYEQKSMGISIEVPMADSPENFGINISLSSNTDLMKGSSEKDEVAISPTVEVAGNFEGNRVTMNLSHCAELSSAALEGNVTIVVYTKADTASEGVGKVSRRELSPPECEIKKDTLSFCIDRPGLYTASIKGDMCEGKRVALLAFLPRRMPENRRPILNVNFYYPFGEIGKRIRDQWEENDNVCVKDETTFILRQIGQDAEVCCEMLSLKKSPVPLKSKLETRTLDCVPYECIDFKLDYTHEETDEVTIKLRVFQKECRSEIDIKHTLKDPQSDEPEQVEVEPPCFRIPQIVTDQVIDAMSSHKMHSDRLSVLTNALGFSTKDFETFVSDNMSSAEGRKGYAGTNNLLTRWRNRTDEADQRPELREAFRRSNLADLTKRYLQVKDDFLD